MVRARGDIQTGDLLSWEPPKVGAGFEPGAIRGSRLASQISQAVAIALKGHDRDEIAQRMSDELGYTVSRNMIDNYASEGQEAHKISLERFIALVDATGCIDALGFIAERFGQMVVPEKYGAIVEVHLIEEREQDLARRKQAALAKVRGVR